MDFGFKVNFGLDEKDQDIAHKLCTKFFKQADKLKAGPMEIAAAIAAMQEFYFDEFGAVPISEKLLDAINQAHIIETKEG